MAGPKKYFFALILALTTLLVDGGCSAAWSVPSGYYG